MRKSETKPKKEVVRTFLQALGMPKEQLSDICCLSMLALAHITEADHWTKATNEWTRIHDVIAFCNEHYHTSYAENSRETFRKQAMHHFRNAAIIEDNQLATNSPSYSYRITDEVLGVFRALGSKKKDQVIQRFNENHQSLIDLYQSKKHMNLIDVKINNQLFAFSTGSHNLLQKAILEEFAPRFAPGAECLYVGDTTKKDLVKESKKLEDLGFAITLHDKMPDVVLYCEAKQWLFFIEAVYSGGPMNPERISDISKMTKNVTVGKIFVTAFPDFATYRKFCKQLAWETEIWIAEEPDHMIHLNGDRFLGPR